MKALILAGGKGTRLRPITHTTAKQLVPIANKPILHHSLDNIFRAGITEIAIIISPDTGELIKESVYEWIKDKNIDITFILQDSPDGLAHAVKISEDYIKNDSFLMYLGDNLIKKDLKELIDKFNAQNYDSLILLKEVNNPLMFGVANIEGNKILKLEEKPKEPKSNLALVGVYVFNKRIFEAVNAIKPSFRGELEITDAIQYLLDNNSNIGYEVLDAWWLDTGKKDDLLEANRIVLDDLTETIIEGNICCESKIEGRVSIGKDTNISNCLIRGPVVIGEGCNINNSYIGPFTSISDNVLIDSAELEYTVVMKNSMIKDIKGRIAESLIGSNVVIKCSKDIPHTHKLLIGDHSNVLINDNT